MATLAGFNANDIDTTTTYDALPAGTYVAVISGSEMRPNRNGTGEYLKLEFTLVENGRYDGRKVWANLNLRHPNPTTVEIARKDLASICKAVGVLAPQDSTELHDIPLLVRVATRTLPDGTTQNDVKGYAPRTAPQGASGAAPAASAAPAAAKPATAPQGASGTVPPWQR